MEIALYVSPKSFGDTLCFIKTHNSIPTKSSTSEMKKFLKHAAMVAALCSIFGASQAAVITFDDGLDTTFAPFAPFGLLGHGDALIQGDYFVATVSTKGDAEAGNLVGALINGNDVANTCFGIVCPTNNSTQFLGMVNDGLPYIQRLDGGLFSLSKLDASFIAAAGDAIPSTSLLLYVYGFFADGTNVYETMLFPGPEGGNFSFATYELSPEFAALQFVEVDFYGYACNAAGSCNRAINKAQFALDNINVFGTDNVVPEPGTFALLGLAFAAMGVVSRRRRLAV